MKKEEFLLRVRSRLDYLLDEEIEKEISLLSNKINDDNDVKSLGSVDDVCKNIYASRGINYTKLHGDNAISRSFEELFLIVHNLVEQMGKNSFKSNVKIIIDLLILFVFIALVKVPFIAIRDLGDSLFNYFNITMLSNVWGIILELLYVVVAIILFINIFNRYFKNFKGEGKKEKVSGKALESISLDDKKEDGN